MISYAKAVYGKEEKDAVMNSLENTWLAAGTKVNEFEKAVAKKFGKKYGIATNSGSSANLLAIASLNLPKDSEVITPACTFATTVAPLIQNNLKPVYIDSVVGRYTINEELVENVITDKTIALMIPQLIGGVVDMSYLRKLANKYGLYIVDDSCDTFAPSLNKKPLARFSDVTTTSFYGSHIITSMGSGGMMMTDDERIYEKARSLVNWGRVGTDNEDFDERFDFQISDIPYDAKFIYSSVGYNLKMTEAQAAFGLVQLDKLEEFKQKREKNHSLLTNYLKKYEKWFYLPRVLENAETTWLAYALTIKDAAPFERYDFLKHLDQAEIQIRVLFSGNITRHPAFKSDQYLPSADKIMKSGLLIGCHQGLSEDDITYMINTMEEFLCRW